ncbi:hypothetical protein BASA83_004753 [Batrachochytrium salamandrivorans]|nr:hypothetical protein BASA83_004753 [Batrachochytrium salamandrivorans]
MLCSSTLSSICPQQQSSIQPLSDDSNHQRVCGAIPETRNVVHGSTTNPKHPHDQLFQEKIAESYLLQQFAASNIKYSNAESSAHPKETRLSQSVVTRSSQMKTWNMQQAAEDFFQHAPNSLLPFESDTRGNDGVELTVKDMPELRAVINLDITIDTQAMVDQFEWDIGCKRNNPEVFAEHLVNELGLIPEFKTAISHSIREQVQTLSKSLLLIDHKFDAPLLPTNTGGLIDDEDLATHFLPVITPRLVKRGVKEHGEFGPYLRVASAVDLERNEKELERDTRRKRRQTQRSRRLITLPDRESTRTNRTPVPRSFQFVSNPIVDASLVANAELRADANSVSVAATASGAGTGGSSTATSRFGAASGVTGTGVYNTRRRGQ